MLSKLSKKARSISTSLTLDITSKANEMKNNGIDVISFGAGEPDFETPQNIKDEGIKAIKNGLTKYTASSGIRELKKEICKKLYNENGLSYDTDNIIISNGAKHSLFNALSALLNPKDEVIISAPYWVSYPEMVKLTDGIPVFIETKRENNFKLTINDLNEKLNSKTKVLILNSPGNPTGTSYNKEELMIIAKWAIDNDIFIISDEIYEKLIYDNKKHISIASLNNEIKRNTIVINGMSKAYAMTGWRIGYAAADISIATIMGNIQSHSTSNPCSISQYASIAAFNNSEAVDKMKKEFEKRRNFMVDKINSIDGLACQKPDGAFYVMVDFDSLIGKEIKGIKINGSLDFSRLLLENSNVAVIPGVAFGSDNYVRLSYATSMENIREGLKRIEDCLK